MKNLSIILLLVMVLIASTHQKANGKKKKGEYCKKKADCIKGLRCKKNKCFEPKASMPKNWLRCPRGWVEYDNDCYLISNHAETWSNANRFCQSKGGQLLLIDSDIVLDFSMDFFSKFRLRNSYFIGARYNYGWKWLDGTNIQPSGYMWSKCGNSNSLLFGDCATLSYEGLDSCNCKSKKNFICSKKDWYRKKSTKRITSCVSSLQCKQGLVCRNRECICPVNSFITLDKCSSPSDSNLVVHIGSDARLEFFSSKLKFSWLDALKQSENFNVDLLVLNNFNQMINFIDFAIKNELSGPFWIGAFALDRKLNWIDGSSLPKGPWLPSYKKCVNYQVGQGLVCFALENYQVVIKNCDQEYQGLFVQGINFSKANLQSLIARLSTFTAAPRTTTQPANSEEWNYKDKGPDYWAIAFENCRAESQSPINIVGSSATFDRGLRDFVFRNYNRIITWNVENNGHSISASPIPTESNMPFIRGSDFTERYNLLNFHFHWGYNIYQGSEHLLNGKKFPLEVHLVHQSVSGKIAVLGFFFEIASKKNRKLDEIISVANIKNKTDIRQIDFSLFSMLPAGGAVLNRRGYFRYSGSFTTPPCTEGVTWTVFRMKIPISKEQVEKFYESGIDINFREVQPLNNRVVTANFR